MAKSLKTPHLLTRFRSSVSCGRACSGLTTGGCKKTENKLSCEMKRNRGKSAGAFGWIWFSQSYAPGCSPANSGDAEVGSVGDLTGSEAADPAARGSAAAAVIAEVFSIPAVLES